MMEQDVYVVGNVLKCKSKAIKRGTDLPQQNVWQISHKISHTEHWSNGSWKL